VGSDPVSGSHDDQTGQADNVVVEKRVDFGYNALGQFTSVARYKDTDTKLGSGLG